MAHKLNSFKVVMSNNCIVLFLAIDSIKQKLGIDVKPDGEIRGVKVCDVQSLFCAIESSDKHTHIVNYLDAGLEEDAHINLMQWEKFTQCVNINTLCKHVYFQLLKHTIIALDEVVWIDRGCAELLIQRYGKRKARVKANRRRFGV